MFILRLKIISLILFCFFEEFFPQDSYINYLQSNESLKVLAPLIQKLNIQNKTHIKNRTYNESEITNIVQNFDIATQKNLMNEIKQQYSSKTKINFDDPALENCFLKGIVKKSSKQLHTIFWTFSWRRL